MKMTRWAAPTALAVAVVGAPLSLIPSAAQAATGGTDSFSVWVRDYATDTGLAGMQVTLYDTATGAVVETAPAVTGETGYYAVSNLTDGTYVAKVHDPSGKHHDVYSTSATVTADDGGFVIAEAAPVGYSRGKLTGTVTQTNSTRLDTRVFIFPSDVTQADITSGSVRPVGATSADSYDPGTTQSANWSDVVPAGSYKVAVGGYDGSYDPGTGQYTYTWDLTWVGGGTSADSATIETVAGGATKAVGSIALAPGVPASAAQISGTVTGGGADLSDIRVSLLEQKTTTDYYGYSETYWADVDDATTNASGTFAFSGEPAGVYTLRFNDEHNEYNPVYLGNVATSDTATTFTVTTDGAGSFKESAALTKAPVDHSSGALGTFTTDDGKAHEGEVEFFDVYGNYITSVETHRDGTWSLTAADLPPGQYKVETTSYEGYYGGGYNYDPTVLSGWYGGKTFKKAATLTVPVKGALNAGGSKNLRPGTISGTISVPKEAGTDTSALSVEIFDAQGNRVWSNYEYEAGTSLPFSATGLAPGTYYVEAVGDAYNSLDTSVGDEVSRVDFIDQFYSGKYTLGSATGVTLGSGGTAKGINITLGNTITATSKPTISGTPKVGQTLTAGVGSWSVLHDLGYAWTWTSNGAVVSHGSSYKVATGDSGKTISLTITASDLNGDFKPGTATSSGDKIATVAKKHKKHKKGKKGKKK